MRVRIRFTLSRWRGSKKSTGALSIASAEESKLAIGEGPESQPIVSVTSLPGSLAFGPTVEMALRLADKTGLVVEMRLDEAVDLANELLMAVRMSERKYELKFGMDWRRAV
jgi:hypothetical protein